MIYTTDYLSQIETQSWQICQICQYCQCFVICENIDWIIWSIKNTPVMWCDVETLCFYLLNIGNTLILRAISSNKELQTPTNLFLASLAVADLLFTIFIPIQTVSWRIILSPLSGDYCFSLEVDNRFQQSCCKQLCTFNGWSFVKMRFSSNFRYVTGPIEDHMPFQVRKPSQQYHYKNHHETAHTTKIPPQKAIRNHHKPPETCKTLRNVPICES